MLFLFILNLCQHLIFVVDFFFFFFFFNTGTQFCFQAAFVCLFSLLVNAETAKCSYIYIYIYIYIMSISEYGSC